jgi:hypothetical protein
MSGPLRPDWGSGPADSTPRISFPWEEEAPGYGDRLQRQISKIVEDKKRWGQTSAEPIQKCIYM